MEALPLATTFLYPVPLQSKPEVDTLWKNQNFN